MAKSSSRRERANVKLDPVFARALREALFFLLAGACARAAYRAASFDRSDRSFSFTGEPGQVSNLIGPLGAHVADLLLLFFGWPAYLFPFVIAFSAWIGLMRVPGEPGRDARPLRCASSDSCSCSRRVAGLRRLHYDGGTLPAGAGGILGTLVGDESRRACFAARRHARDARGLVRRRAALYRRLLATGHGFHRSRGPRGRLLGAQPHCDVARPGRRAANRASARETAVREVQKKAATRTPPRIETAAPPAAEEPSMRVEKERQVQLFAKPPHATCLS